METFCRFIVYIIAANLAYLVFDRVKEGFKHYSNYIAELLFVLIAILWMLQRGIGIGWILFFSLVGVFALCIMPAFLQHRIDQLIADKCYAELAPYAKLKYAFAWSNINRHIEEMALIAEETHETPGKMIDKLKELLGRGEPYDGITRNFIGQIHFNGRSFNELINDLRIPNKSFDDQSFEELLLLIRAYLETTRYEEAVEAQFALEKKIYVDDDNKANRIANSIINRLVFFAFMGWKDEYDRFHEENERELVAKLPEELREFWQGVCYFNAGDYSEGERKMLSVIQTLPEEADYLKVYLQKRYNGMMEHKEFFQNSVRPKLEELHSQFNEKLENLVKETKVQNIEVLPENRVTNLLSFIISVISVICILLFNVEDVVDLVKVGANSAFLVEKGEYFRLVSYMFIHIGWVHLFMNLIAIRYFGPIVETIGGWPCLILIFLISGIAGGLLTVYNGNHLSVGASGGALGLLSAAIVFGFFKIKKIKNFSNKSSMSSFIFILVINIALGFVDKAIDNSCHIGGLIAGALMGLMAVPFIKQRILRGIGAGLAVLTSIIILGFGIWHFGYVYKSQGFYPKNVKEYKKCEIASASFRVEIPIEWRIDEDSATFQEAYAIGPLKEKVDFIIGLNSDSSEEFLKKYISERSAEFEKEESVELVYVEGPTKKTFKSNTYGIKWGLKVLDSRIVMEEYVNFEGGFVIFTRLIASTQKTEEYENILEHCSKSFQIK